MNKTTLEFLKPGLHTLIQDLGRTSHKKYGVPLGGALDRSSAILANTLVGNDASSPLLEITISGPKIRFTGNTDSKVVIAITGANLSPTLDDRPIEMYSSIKAAPGSILAFGKLKSGCRAYLAVRGAWQIRSWLGSASAIFPDLPDITPDSFIKKGSLIDISYTGWKKDDNFSGIAKPLLSVSNMIRLLPGPEIHLFSETVIKDFCNVEHTITPSSNRWGYQLDSIVPTREAGLEIISSGVIPGTIQIVHSGNPVILMADAQTTGGYPRIAIVASADMDRLAQFKPSDTLRFKFEQ